MKMPKFIASGAAQADADLCNVVDAPARGCNTSLGLQIIIPPDWQARIAAGQVVPGCTYHALQQEGPVGGPFVNDALVVTDRAAAQLALPAVINALTLQQQTQAAALNTKLASAVQQAQVIA